MPSARDLLNMLNELWDDITEMSYKRKFARKKTQELQQTVARHLVKVFLYPAHQDREKWIHELNMWASDVFDFSSAKSGGSNLDHDFLVQTFWDQPLGTPQDRANKVAALVGKLRYPRPDHPESIESPDFQNLVMSYIDTLLDPEAVFQP